jgi:hypothetical protein
MIKRVNFTGRRRLTRECVSIVVHAGSPRTFDAAIDLSGSRMPDTAAVYIEATSAGSSVVQRFSFGTAGRISPPVDRQLTDVDGQNVFFHLKVVDQTERVGRLLGVAERIRPEEADTSDEAGSVGILPIEEADLGQQLWRLEFGESDVTLLVNSEAPDLKGRLKWDPSFFAAIYPAVVNMILKAALDGGDLEDEDATRWQTQWLRFGKSLHPEGAEPPILDADDQQEWVDEVVSAFAERHCLRDLYVKAAPVYEEDE